MAKRSINLAKTAPALTQLYTAWCTVAEATDEDHISPMWAGVDIIDGDNPALSSEEIAALAAELPAIEEIIRHLSSEQVRAIARNGLLTLVGNPLVDRVIAALQLVYRALEPIHEFNDCCNHPHTAEGCFCQRSGKWAK